MAMHVLFALRRFSPLLAVVLGFLILSGLPGAPRLALGHGSEPVTCEDVLAATTRGGAASGSAPSGGFACSSRAAVSDDGLYLVKRVIDGDTIALADGRRVRYIGIDAPEMRPSPEPFARQATDANKKIVEGRYVHLLRGRSDRDQYDRLLRYVLVDGILAGSELVREGLARVREYEPGQPFAQCDASLEREARVAKRGLWAGP